MDGWNTIVSFWVSAYFQGLCKFQGGYAYVFGGVLGVSQKERLVFHPSISEAFAVSFREGKDHLEKLAKKCLTPP